MINDNNYILIADKNFINKKITSAVKFLEIFPSENSKLVYKSTLQD